MSNDPEYGVSREDVQRLYDLAVADGMTDQPGSCRFDSDDVDLLRRLAVMLGRDPLDSATPRAHRRNYPHPYIRSDWFVEGNERRPAYPDEQVCIDCGLGPEAEKHQPVPAPITRPGRT